MCEQVETEAASVETMLLRKKRALYRAQYRGTKEMDWMIGRYAADRLTAMNVSELEAFEAFLQIGDPEINAWLLANVTCEETQFVALVDDIRAFHSLV